MGMLYVFSSRLCDFDWFNILAFWNFCCSLSGVFLKTVLFCFAFMGIYAFNFSRSCFQLYLLEVPNYSFGALWVLATDDSLTIGFRLSPYSQTCVLCNYVI